MINGNSGLREFGKFRLDLDKKLLWVGTEPVPLPFKAVDLLCVLVEKRGEVVSKSEIWHEVWNDAFVEETNLTHNIYTLRKAFKDLGEPDLIKTVPRRGYRFTGTVHEIPYGEIILERHSLTRTTIEFEERAALPAALKPVRTRAMSYAPFAAAVLLLSVLGGMAFWQSRSSRANSSTVIKSIAVLPLKSFGSENEDEELRLRITDALITRLGNMKEIAVRPTGAVLPFVNDQRDAIDIGGKLVVDTVLEGRIQREGDRVRVTLQLLSVQTGKQIWAEQFDGQANRILNLQDNISAKVLSSLNAGVQTSTLANAPTANTDAYEAYLKGRYFWGKRDEESLHKAIGYFRDAIALDPQFSEAYSGTADAQLLLFDQNIEVSPTIITQARENLDRALSLKPDSADALITLGGVQMSYDWDWDNAELSLRKATENAPNSPNAWMRYGALLLRLGRVDASQNAFERAITLDPLSQIAQTNLGMAYFCKKDFDAADRQYRKTLEIDNRFGMSHWLLSRSLWQQGQKEESIREILLGLESDGNEPLAGRLREKSQVGNPEDVIRLLLYEWRGNPSGTNPHNLAYLSTYVNDREKALFWLERSLEEHHPWTTWVAAAPEFEVLHGDPRFQEILRKTNLPEK